FEEVANLAADNIQVVNYATGQTFNGKDEFRNFMSGFKTAFPDLVIKHTNVFEGGDGYVALEFEGEGTHTGPLAGPGGTIPPTGKKVKFIVCETHRVMNGKIASIHNYQDSGSLMRQLGLMPAPPAEAPAK
ncbi:MAG: ester cyclase, partial [Saprospiraceae bacterium]